MTGLDRPRAVQPPDAGHLLPPDVWAEVAGRARLEERRIRAGHLVSGRFGATTALSGTVIAPNNGGRRPGGNPTFGVFHSAETPLSAGYAASIARMFATTTQQKSCHYMIDPAETWGVLPEELIAWHVGNGNPNSVGLEHAGYASFSRADWTGPAGAQLIARSAAVVRGIRDRYGIAPRMMTDAELLAAHRRQAVGGWATHDQCRRVLGGTTHTDPGPGFPTDLVLAAVADAPALPPVPATTGETPVRIAKAVGTAGPIYLVTDLEVTATNAISLVDSLARLHGIPLVDLHQQQIDLIAADATRRRTALGLPVPRTAAAIGPGRVEVGLADLVVGVPGVVVRPGVLERLAA